MRIYNTHYNVDVGCYLLLLRNTLYYYYYTTMMLLYEFIIVANVTMVDYCWQS